jgi:hypothetical protein
MTVGDWPLSRLTVATFILVALEVAFASLMPLASSRRERAGRPARTVNRLIVRELGITDLALSTGVGYTRHPSQADMFSAFGSHPAALEHFPGGSVIPPPHHSRMSEPSGGAEGRP